MRTTTMALVCSLAACAPVGNPGAGDYGSPDAGVDGAPAGGPCDNLVERALDLTITGSAGFTNLPTTCWRLNGKLTLRGPAVTSVAKLGDLRGVVDLEIDDTDLTTFDSKVRIDVSGDIRIHHNDKLTDIANIGPRGTIDALVVEHNSTLTNLGGLAQTEIVAGPTTIANNSKLTAVSLGSATRLEGGVTIRDNGSLTSIDLKSLQSSGALTITNNTSLKTLTTTSQLTHVHGSLAIDNNDALTTLGTLGMALTINGSVLVANNGALVDVGQLDHAGQVLGAVQITSNTALPLTEVHDVGCCVAASAFTASNNKANSSCSGNHWCLANQQNCFFN